MAKAEAAVKAEPRIETRLESRIEPRMEQMLERRVVPQPPARETRPELLNQQL